MTDIILWRHAEAEDTSTSGRDADRALTKRGRKDAAKIAEWLKKHLPSDTLVLASPARRCQETAAALADITDFEFRTVAYLSADSKADVIRKQLAVLSAASTILIVGHQPNLGYLIAEMLKMQDSACVVKKGAVWWLRQRMADADKKAPLQTYLFTVQHPDYL